MIEVHRLLQRTVAQEMINNEQVVVRSYGYRVFLSRSRLDGIVLGKYMALQDDLWIEGKGKKTQRGKIDDDRGLRQEKFPMYFPCLGSFFCCLYTHLVHHVTCPKHSVAAISELCRERSVACTTIRSSPRPCVIGATKFVALYSSGLEISQG